MGNLLDTPKRDKIVASGEGPSFKYGLACMQGWRLEMEDAHCVQIGLGDSLKDWSYFAVFDGHNGARLALYSAKHLLDIILATEEFKDNVAKGIRQGFLDLDQRVRCLYDQMNEKSGTTAVCAIISPDKIYIGNCGDSRAMLCNGEGHILATQDHKPYLAAEKERIFAAGGSVEQQRVDGILSLSRALGDFPYKSNHSKGQCEQKISPEPEIFVWNRDNQNEFLVLACDGIWDVIKNEDMCSFVRGRLAINHDLKELTSQIIDTAYYKNSYDNMSVIVVAFPGAPRPCQPAIRADQILDDSLKKKVKEILEENQISFNQLKSKLEFEEGLPPMPPGGGLEAKCSIIEPIFIEMCPSLAETVYYNRPLCG